MRNEKTVTDFDGKNHVKIIEGKGVMTISRKLRIELPQSGGAKRGAVKGWSPASRRRMREALLTLSAPVGWMTAGVTLTIPPPPMTPKAAKDLFTWYARQTEKEGCGLIWRMEIQERGELHFHLVSIAPDMAHLVRFLALWFDALRRAGPVTFDPPYLGKNGSWKYPLSHCSSRANMPGAAEHAARIDFDEGAGARGAWLRYLSDHSTKSKQAQIPDSCGRHWGIVGRSKFVRGPASVVEMSDRGFFAYLRATRRLASGRCPSKRPPFADRISTRRRAGYGGAVRGGWGKSVFFTRTETASRLASACALIP